MNDMTDAQISRALALAIGWQESDFYQYGDDSFVAVRYKGHESHYREFDYRSPDVAWAVAERFDCFPLKVTSKDYWIAQLGHTGQWHRADTAAKAVALAVIAAHGG